MSRKGEREEKKIFRDSPCMLKNTEWNENENIFYNKKNMYMKYQTSKENQFLIFISLYALLYVYIII